MIDPLLTSRSFSMKQLHGFCRLIPAALGFVLQWSAHGATNGTDSAFVAENYSRKTIYHSAQKPGYTCWVGGWQMPDRSLMVTFKEVTGPAQGRPRAKPEWQEAFGLMKVDPARDFTGLHMADMYLRSTNGGSNWNVVAAAQFEGPATGYVWGGSHCPLSGSTILRAVDGSAVPGMNLPRRVFFQRSH